MRSLPALPGAALGSASHNPGVAMASMFLLTYSAPIRDLEIGDVLITQGEAGTDLFVLEAGQLAVERDGVKIATIDQHDSLIGEMGLLLQRPHSATVRAEDQFQGSGRRRRDEGSAAPSRHHAAAGHAAVATARRNVRAGERTQPAGVGFGGEIADRPNIVRLGDDADEALTRSGISARQRDRA